MPSITVTQEQADHLETAVGCLIDARERDFKFALPDSPFHQRCMQRLNDALELRREITMQMYGTTEGLPS